MKYLNFSILYKSLAIVILIYLTKVSIFWLDQLFFLGLALFTISGFLFLINSSGIQRMIRSFKKFYTKTSKLESYVSESVKETPVLKPKKIHDFKGTIVKKILTTGLILIAITTTSSFVFY